LRKLALPIVTHFIIFHYNDCRKRWEYTAKGQMI
jgi:hypothetical protein